jgi:NAD(P)-dependent dehydrogenase (short-subunit alcohol dehydrogenase family)
MKFDKEVAVITGGTTGIGSATCTKLQQEGAIVYNLDIHDIGAEGVHFIQCDVRKYEEVKNAIRHIVDKEGKIDLLFANAGVHMSGNIEETGIDDFENVLSINLKGMFYTIKEVIPIMRKQQKGSIVLTGSDQSFIGKGNSSAYGLTKGAIGQFTKSTAIDYAPYNIRVNCICPGTIETPLLTKAIAGFDALTNIGKDAIYKMLEDAQPIKRIGKPEEIAHVVSFLLSHESSFITGALIAADGGYTCQ